MNDDAELLRRYFEDGSEAAFAMFVKRYIDLVYGAALRRLGGDAHGAADVSQQVFVAAARQATTLARRPGLTGWIYTTTRNAAINHMRDDRRRKKREHEACVAGLLPCGAEASTDWERVKPVLDVAMDELSGDDREAVLLRFFEGRAFADVGQRLQLSENAARMRVERALEKLHGLLMQRGVTSTATALAVTLSSQLAAAAPTSVLATVTSAALAGTGFTAAGVGAAPFMVSIKLQLGIAGALLAAGTVGVVAQLQANATLRAEISTLRQQTSALVGMRAKNRRLEQRAAEVITLQGDDAEFRRLNDQVAVVKSRQEQAAQAEVTARVAHESALATQPVFSEEQLDAKPKARQQPRPKFPPELRIPGGRGEARLSFVVDADGNVRDVQVLSSTSSSVSEASVAAVRQWRYEPGQKSGHPVNSRVQLPMVFINEDASTVRKVAKPGDPGWRWF